MSTPQSFPILPITATLRLQFHKGFTFDDAIKHLQYFSALGISHIYCSPILKSRSGSTHGYDVVDPSQINPEIGGIEGFRRFVVQLRQIGLGIIVDIVPNHMGIGGAENPWWQHMLQWGEKSPFANWFDVEWDSKDPTLHRKIITPFLEHPYGETLRLGEVALRYSAQYCRFEIHYGSNRYPIRYDSYTSILKSGLSDMFHDVIRHLDAIQHDSEYFNVLMDVERAIEPLCSLSHSEDGKAEIEYILKTYDPTTLDGRSKLHALLEDQNFRLTWWRNAADEINWRRFFEISDLAGIKVEIDEVFDASHALILSLYQEGLIDGVRLDHIDGLANPKQYCLKLRATLDALAPKRPLDLHYRPYIIAEKILGPDEWLRPEWGLDGTTGYEFMDQSSALFHDERGSELLTSIWHKVTLDRLDFKQQALKAKAQIISENLVGEFKATADAFHQTARSNIDTRDYSYAAIERVLYALLLYFPVYRSYISEDGPDEIDKKVFKTAISNARTTLSYFDKPLLDVLYTWLSEPLKDFEDSDYDLRQKAITRFQQLLPPLTAKAIEDTTFYRYGRLLSRNEVGSDPFIFSIDKSRFHEIAASRLERYPHSILATATHDHKRGEDVRMRLAILSQKPNRWDEVIRDWFDINAGFHSEFLIETVNIEKGSAPRPWHEYMYYQTLVGTWPYDLDIHDQEQLTSYSSRLKEWMIKSIREAKRLSTWVQKNEVYEGACISFIESTLDISKSNPFLEYVQAFVNEISAMGAINSIAQTLLKMTSPGIPDFYQGSELWDLSMVDPDNRREVDYGLREDYLVKSMSLEDRAENWHDGSIKQHVIQNVLNFRKTNADIFDKGEYLPLVIIGPKAQDAIAYIRSHQDRSIIVVLPLFNRSKLAFLNKLRFSNDAWNGTYIEFPYETKKPYFEVLTKKSRTNLPAKLMLSDLFAKFPVSMIAIGEFNQPSHQIIPTAI